jgi:hypothetical protein
MGLQRVKIVTSIIKKMMIRGFVPPAAAERKSGLQMSIHMENLAQKDLANAMRFVSRQRAGNIDTRLCVAT